MIISFRRGNIEFLSINASRCVFTKDFMKNATGFTGNSFFIDA
jgi:hypothetical protein